MSGELEQIEQILRLMAKPTEANEIAINRVLHCLANRIRVDGQLASKIQPKQKETNERKD